MHILTLTTLFPNSLMPVHAVFVRARMEAYTRKYGHAWTVVAPVPYFPKLPFGAGSAYGVYARVPDREQPWGYPLYHPRYLLTPKIGMRWYGDWMARGIRGTVLAIHRKTPIDAIDGHYIYPDGTAAVRLGRELGIPVILSARGTDLNLYPDLPHIAPLLRANLAACGGLICVCNELKEVALRMGMDPSRTRVIGNGVDTERFRPGDKTAARAKLGLPAGKTLVLSVGHLTERKGFHLVLEACARLGRGDVSLVLAGDGPQRGELERLAASLGMTGRVHFAGAVSNAALPDWYQAADLFALASSREGWPNVLCEAQACGLPSIATKVWGIPEIISEDGLGILVPERTAEAFRASLEAALARPWDRAHIAAKGASRTWSTVADALEEVFQGARAPRNRDA